MIATFYRLSVFALLTTAVMLNPAQAQEACAVPFVDSQFNIQIPCYQTEESALAIELSLQVPATGLPYWDLGTVNTAECNPDPQACATTLVENGDLLHLSLPHLSVFGVAHQAQFQVVIDAEHVNGGFFNQPRLNTGKPLTVNLIHINDHHSHLVEESINLTLDGVTTRVNMGGFARVGAQIKALRRQVKNPLVLHIGDAMVGTLFYSVFKGEADAAVMNAVGFDAMTLGNHEFDDGNANLKTFLNRLEFPIITANIDFAQSADLAPSQLTRPIEPYLIKTIEGQSVALVGINTLKTLISSSPGRDITFTDEVATAQRVTAELEAQGINKIIYLTHYGYSQEQAMALQVAGIDVILGGDSHTLLGDFHTVGLSSEGPYPTIVTSPRGEPVCIAHAWQYSYIVGHLTVNFDEKGVVSECFGQPTLLLGDDFQQQGEAVNEATKTRLLDLVAAHPSLAVVTPDSAMATILANYNEQVEQLDQEVIGQSTDDLLHIRIPGTHSSGTELPNGSLIAPLVAKGFFQQLATRNHNPDLVIQNAGGVRTDVPAGPITIQTAYTLLPFGNTIVILEMSGSEIKQVLEEALINHFDNDGSSGSFPYAYGIRYTIDMNQAAGERITQLELLETATGEYSELDLNATYRVGTNSFIANGRDGYLAFGRVPNDKRLDTFFDYAESFINYVREVGTLSAPEETSVTFIPAS